MSWEPYRLDDVVEFTPRGGGDPIHAMGCFVVFAESKLRADVSARLHLCMMLKVSGVMEFERSEFTDDLPE